MGQEVEFGAARHPQKLTLPTNDSYGPNWKFCQRVSGSN